MCSFTYVLMGRCVMRKIKCAVRMPPSFSHQLWINGARQLLPPLTCTFLVSCRITCLATPPLAWMIHSTGGNLKLISWCHLLVIVCFLAPFNPCFTHLCFFFYWILWSDYVYQSPALNLNLSLYYTFPQPALTLGMSLNNAICHFPITLQVLLNQSQGQMCSVSLYT